VRQFIHWEDSWAVGPWNEPNQRPEATAQERRCAESESLDRIHGCSAPCLIHGVRRKMAERSGESVRVPVDPVVAPRAVVAPEPQLVVQVD